MHEIFCDFNTFGTKYKFAVQILLFISDVPVSIEGSMVQRRVSSAVHTVHIGASPDAVKNRDHC